MQCLVTHLIALAIADKAILSDSLQSARDILEFHVPPDFTHYAIKLEWKESMLEIPIFRQYINGAISPTQCLTVDTFSRQTKEAGQAYGFKEAFTIHSIRRRTGAEVDSKFHYSYLF